MHLKFQINIYHSVSLKHHYETLIARGVAPESLAIFWGEDGGQKGMFEYIK